MGRRQTNWRSGLLSALVGAALLPIASISSFAAARGWWPLVALGFIALGTAYIVSRGIRSAGETQTD